MLCSERMEAHWNKIFGMIIADPGEAPINQKQTITTRTRLKVTTCLYLSPNNRARSLSALIAVDVKMDTAQRMKAETQFASITEFRAFTSIFVKGANMLVTTNGCATHRKKSFVGE